MDECASIVCPKGARLLSNDKIMQSIPPYVFNEIMGRHNYFHVVLDNDKIKQETKSEIKDHIPDASIRSARPSACVRRMRLESPARRYDLEPMSFGCVS